MTSAPHECRNVFRALRSTVVFFALLILGIVPAVAATRTVTNLANSGAGSLRQTVLDAGAGDTIVLPASGSIALGSPIDLNKPLFISGSGANAVSVSGSGSTRLFNVTSTVTIADVALINGFADGATQFFGGAIHNSGNLTLLRVALRNNNAFDGGGAIYNISGAPGQGILTLKACELSANNVTGTSGIGGGAIASTSSTGTGAVLTLVNSTLANNKAAPPLSTMVGGAIYASRGSVNIVNSTLDGNHAGATGANLHLGTAAGGGLSLRNSLIGDALLDLPVANADRDIFLPNGTAFSSLGYNIVHRRPAVAGLGASDAPDGIAPGLSALANNGGPTQTMKPAAGSNALWFVPLASCVDEAGSPLLTDQRSSARRATGALACDSGAFETATLSASVFSQKLHGGTPRRLPLDGSAPIGGAITVEPRVIGSGHTLVFQFASPVSSVGSVRVVDAAGTAIGVFAAPQITSNEVSVNLTGIPDQRRISVALLGVNGAFNSGVSLGFLVGDVTGNRTIGAAQLAAEKSRAGQDAATAFLYDLNLSGRVSAADIAGVKARSGRSLP